MSNKEGNRLEVRKIDFTIGGIGLQGYTADEIDPVTGEYINYLSSRQLAQSIDKYDDTTQHSRMGKDLKALLGKGFKLIEGNHKNVRGGNTKLNLWSLNYAYIYYLYNYNKSYSDKIYTLLVGLGRQLGKDISILQKTHLLNKPQNSRKNLERNIQISYLDKFGGVTEVNTEYGRIDLLTDDALYEFKDLRRYKEALGQLLAYGTEYPDRELIAVFFGSKRNDIEKVRDLFELFSIKTEFV